MKSLIQHIAESKALHQNANIAESKALHQNVNIAESKALHQNVNIDEKLLINKDFKGCDDYTWRIERETRNYRRICSYGEIYDLADKMNFDSMLKRKMLSPDDANIRFRTQDATLTTHVDSFGLRSYIIFGYDNKFFHGKFAMSIYQDGSRGNEFVTIELFHDREITNSLLRNMVRHNNFAIKEDELEHIIKVYNEIINGAHYA